MSALKGSLTYCRFFVDIAPPKDFRERYMRAIRLRTLAPLSASDEDMERTGFCAIGDPFDLELNPTKVVYEGFLNLGVRTDRWVFPSSLVKARVREAEALYLAKKGRQRLSKHERVELKQAVQQKLKHKLTPQVRAVDLSWSLDEQVVRYFTHSAKSIANMVELFEKAFHIKLVQESPYTLAANSAILSQREKHWEQLSPCDLSEQAS